MARDLILNGETHNVYGFNANGEYGIIGTTAGSFFSLVRPVIFDSDFNVRAYIPVSEMYGTSIVDIVSLSTMQIATTGATNSFIQFGSDIYQYEDLFGVNRRFLITYATNYFVTIGEDQTYSYTYLRHYLTSGMFITDFAFAFTCYSDFKSIAYGTVEYYEGYLSEYYNWWGTNGFTFNYMSGGFGGTFVLTLFSGAGIQRNIYFRFTDWFLDDYLRERWLRIGVRVNPPGVHLWIAPLYDALQGNIEQQNRFYATIPNWATSYSYLTTGTLMPFGNPHRQTAGGGVMRESLKSCLTDIVYCASYLDDEKFTRLMSGDFKRYAPDIRWANYLHETIGRAKGLSGHIDIYVRGTNAGEFYYITEAGTVDNNGNWINTTGTYIINFPTNYFSNVPVFNIKFSNKLSLRETVGPKAQHVIFPHNRNDNIFELSGVTMFTDPMGEIYVAGINSSSATIVLKIYFQGRQLFTAKQLYLMNMEEYHAWGTTANIYQISWHAFGV